jgi:hypothetical protein
MINQFVWQKRKNRDPGYPRWKLIMKSVPTHPNSRSAPAPHDLSRFFGDIRRRANEPGELDRWNGTGVFAAFNDIFPPKAHYFSSFGLQQSRWLLEPVMTSGICEPLGRPAGKYPEILITAFVDRSPRCCGVITMGSGPPIRSWFMARPGSYLWELFRKHFGGGGDRGRN